MSYANGTEHYNLPQTVGTDKRDWFDTNSAFAAIDAALYAAATGQAADAEAISTINGKISTIEGNITSLQGTASNHTTQIGALQTSVSGLTNTVADVRQDAEDMISAYNEGAAETSTHAYAIGDYFIYNDVLYKATAAIAIGDTIVPNTNCQATNVTTVIKAVEASIPADKVGDLGSLTTTDKSSAVAAINEVNAALSNVESKVSKNATGIFTPSSDITSGELHFMEMNNIMFVYSLGTLQISSSNLGTVTSSHRPANTVAFPAVNVSDKKEGRISINASTGAVTYSNLDDSVVTTDRIIQCSAVYGVPTS